MTDNSRIRWMDGLRGVAILSVVLFHLYSQQFSSFLPYGTEFSGFFLVRFGWTGVELFFLISGFVILMTLERCATVLEFARRRWLRLFPAMLIASAILLAYDYWIKVGPLAERSWPDVIPGLTFLSPALIHTLTRAHLHSMDGTFWSLYVEVVFYVIFGGAYFLLRDWRAAVVIILSLFGISRAMSIVDLADHSFLQRLTEAMAWLGFVYFSWFAAGALYYKALARKNDGLFILATVLAVTAASTQWVHGGLNPPDIAALCCVVALFAASQRLPILQGLLSHRWIVFLGFVSYPLYLIHENMSIGTMQWLKEHTARGSTDGLLPVIPIAALVALSWLIARFAEPALRAGLRRLVHPLGFHTEPSSLPPRSAHACELVAAPNDPAESANAS